MHSPQQRAIALIQNYYATFNAGDRAAFLTLLTEDVAHDINQGGTESGIAAFRTFLTRMDRCYREQVCDLVVFANTDGTRGAAEFFIEGEYLSADAGLPPATGQRYRLRVGAFFDLHDERVSRVTNYYNLEDWLRQVGA
ncbi:MAG: ketosteroid isomerase-related protein [Prosthecobacter sp.]|uniref:ketosteroid isomerase-related protein n=1 Tax=Prosthecobacter sp. TaxID=1965333 RepID=UPI0038FFA890